MKARKTMVAAMAAMLSFAGAGHAATVSVGTYTLDALVDKVTSFSGTKMWDGAAYIDPMTTPDSITDNAANTFVSTADYAGYRNATLGLGFSAAQGTAVNGSKGLALFFLSDQTGNSADITINGIMQTLTTFNTVSGCTLPDGTITLCGVDGVPGQPAGSLINLRVADVDLSKFGIGAGGALAGSGFSLDLHQTSGSNAMSLALVGVTSVTPVPVPAAAWLFGSGLLGLAGVARKRA